MDAESGLIYYRARHYDPALGQFIQRDPIGFASGDLNLYAYTWNDPYNWTDPAGLAGSADTASTTSLSVAIGTNVRNSIFGALFALAVDIANDIMKIESPPENNPPDDRPDNPPVPADPPPPCDPADPNCKDKCHGNSANSTSPQHAYDIIDTWQTVNGNPLVAKTGISGGRIRLDGQSSRAETQVRAWNKEPGNAGRYRSEITYQNNGGEGARSDVLDYEKQRANDLREDGHLDEDRHTCP